MERIVWTHQSEQPFYVFDERHIVHVWPDGVSIHHVDEGYQDADTRLSPFGGPHLYAQALPREFYKKAILEGRLPISVDMKGANLGVIKRTPGYGDAELGSYKRTIVSQQTELSLADDHLVLRIRTHATPADPKTVTGEVTEDDRAPQDDEFEFRFPVDLAPELVDMTDTETRKFQRGRLNTGPALE
jgi:hypothetical protein